MGVLKWPFPGNEEKDYVYLICDVLDIAINHPDSEFSEDPGVTEFRKDLQEFKMLVTETKVTEEEYQLHIPEHLCEAFANAVLILTMLLVDPEKDADIIRTALFDSGMSLKTFRFIQSDILLMISNQFPSNEDIQYAYVKTLLISEELDTVNTGMP